MQRSLLYFTSREHLLDFAKPSMPHVINVGGLTPKPASGDLPDDFKSFVEGAKRGVVLVTFGSMASRLPKKVVKKFVEAFERLDGFRVVWRLNNIHNVKIPANVKVMSWIPQNDLLAHPSVKLFVTHSGNNGQYEAFYHGVPMIGFPLLGDQEYNALRLVKKGYGIAMNVYDFTADEMNSNMRQILDNPAYKQRIAKAAEIFRSAPMSPVETVVYWIEHVCKFGGDHLRSGGHDLPLYAYWMFDVLAFMLVVTELLAVVGFALCCLARRRLLPLLLSRKRKAD
jgi:UDP:flavonoid glycosyltransferase YjiC (YdhE family)